MDAHGCPVLVLGKNGAIQTNLQVRDIVMLISTENPQARWP